MGEGKQQMMTIFCFSFFLSFHTQLLLGQWKVGTIVVVFSWKLFHHLTVSSDQVERSRQPEKKKGRRGWAKNTWTWFCKYFISYFCILNYFNISTQVRRIREAQEEERRRKLEELKQHVSFFMLFFIGPKSDHCLALSVSQKVRPHVEFCSTWICRSCYSKHRQISSFDNFFAWQAQQAQKFREQQEELRRRHIDELRSKDMDRRAQVCRFPERRF